MTKTEIKPGLDANTLISVDIEDQLQGMGVLENGVPYLTTNGLAKLCNVNVRTIRKIYENWEDEQYRQRGKQIKSILNDAGYSEKEIHIPVILKGQRHNVIPDIVCMAILEYYAFISKERSEQAQHIFRILARVSFREYVYNKVGYNKKTENLEKWKHYHDRVSLIGSSVPNGYFSIFNEIASMIVDLINHNLPVNDKILPDISVGITWSKYWKDNFLEDKYGTRINYEHNYPDYYRQSWSNPQLAKAYPDDALPEFRYWLKNEYLVKKFPKYITKKVTKINLTNKIINIFGNLHDNN